ncbi:hypothetical protein ACWEQ3_50970, partial [Streptomyces mirabilis]
MPGRVVPLESPLLARLRHAEVGARYEHKLSFAKGSMELSKDADRTVDAVAHLITELARQNWREGRPLPTVEIVGYGNDAVGGSSRPQPTDTLAKVAEGALRGTLAKSLRTESQSGRNLPRLGVEHFSIQSVASAAGDAHAAIRVVYRPLRTASANDLARLRYQSAAEEFESRLGIHVVQHPKAIEVARRLTLALWERTPHELRGKLGTDQRIVLGAVGTDLADLRVVARNGNFREQMTMLWNAQRYGVFTSLLGTPFNIPSLQDAKSWREVQPVRARRHAIVPPLSLAEARFTNNAREWMAGQEIFTIRFRPPTRMFEIGDSPHFSAQATGGLVKTAISGTTWHFLTVAEAANRQWGLDIDIRWMRIALVGMMLTTGHHSLDEVLDAAEYWANHPDHRERLGLGFTRGSWDRYQSLSPLSERELRKHVAVGGLFPDETAFEATRSAIDSREIVSGIDVLQARGNDIFRWSAQLDRDAGGRLPAPQAAAAAGFPRTRLQAWSEHYRNQQAVQLALENAARKAGPGGRPGITPELIHEQQRLSLSHHFLVSWGHDPERLALRFREWSARQRPQTPVDALADRFAGQHIGPRVVVPPLRPGGNGGGQAAFGHGTFIGMVDVGDSMAHGLAVALKDLRKGQFETADVTERDRNALDVLDCALETWTKPVSWGALDAKNLTDADVVPTTGAQRPSPHADDSALDQAPGVVSAVDAVPVEGQFVAGGRLSSYLPEDGSQELPLQASGERLVSAGTDSLPDVGHLVANTPRPNELRAAAPPSFGGSVEKAPSGEGAGAGAPVPHVSTVKASGFAAPHEEPAEALLAGPSLRDPRVEDTLAGEAGVVRDLGTSGSGGGADTSARDWPVESWDTAAAVSARDEAGLREAVDRAVGRVAVEPGRVAVANSALGQIDCVLRLEALERELYPADGTFGEAMRLSAGAAVRAAVALDDLVVGIGGMEQRLARGPGWGPVSSWASLAEAVTRVGVGATGLVLALRQAGLGHAFAVHHTTEGVRWIEMQAQAGSRVRTSAPVELPVHARAVVIDGRGQVAVGALETAQARVAALATAMFDAPVVRSYGAVGLETEDQHPLFGPGAMLGPGAVLARHVSGAQIVLDRHPFHRGEDGALYGTREAAARADGGRPTAETYPIPELVMPPLAVLGPLDEGRLPGAHGLALHRQARQLLEGADRAGRPVPLNGLLTGAQGWAVTETGASIQVSPSPSGAGHPAYTQFTVGVPAAGLTPVLDLVRSQLTPPVAFLAPLFDSGRIFADRLAVAFASERLGRTVTPYQLPFLTAVAGLDELHGYAWLVFNHVAASPINRRFFSNQLVKNMLPAASRTPFSVLRGSLTHPVRTYLERNEAATIELVEVVLRQLAGHYRSRLPGARDDTQHILDETTPSGMSHRNYLINALRGTTPQGSEVSQSETVGMTDYELDDNGGRIGFPLALLELRHWSTDATLRTHGTDPRFMTDRAVEVAFDQIGRTANYAYRQAQRFGGENASGLAPAAARAILEHPLVAPVAMAFQALGVLKVPGAGMAADRILPASERAFVAQRLAAHAAGDRLSYEVQDRLASLLPTLKRALEPMPAGIPPMPAELRQPFEQAWTATQRALHAVEQAREDQRQRELTSRPRTGYPHGTTSYAGHQPGGRYGLPGGSRDDGIDPVAENLKIGSAVTLAGPRRGGVTEVSGPPMPSGGGDFPQTWYTLTGSYPNRAEPFSFQAASDGTLRLDGDRTLPPHGWVRYGDDFIHTPSGTLLRADSGWIGQIANWAELRQTLEGADGMD